MDYLDKRIEELLDSNDKHLLRASQPYGLAGLLRQAVEGRLALLVWIAVLLVVLLAIAAVWAVFGLFGAADPTEAIRHGVGTTVFALSAVQLVVAINTHVHTERVLRALKRIEILLRAGNHKPG